MTENQRIKFLRKEAKLSQTDLAEQMGLDQSAISSIESGKNKATKNFKILLSHILKIHFDYIETGAGEKFFKQEGGDALLNIDKDKIIELLENSLRDKDEMIALLREQIPTKSPKDVPTDNPRAVQR